MKNWKQVTFLVFALGVSHLYADESPKVSYAKKDTLELLGNVSGNFSIANDGSRSVSLFLNPDINYFFAENLFVLGGLRFSTLLAKFYNSYSPDLDNSYSMAPRLGVGYSWRLRNELYFNLPMIVSNQMYLSRNYYDASYYFSNNNAAIGLEPQLKYGITDRIFFNITGVVTNYFAVSPVVRWNYISGGAFIGVSYFWP